MKIRKATEEDKRATGRGTRASKWDEVIEAAIAANGESILVCPDGWDQMSTQTKYNQAAMFRQVLKNRRLTERFKCGYRKTGILVKHVNADEKQHD